MPVRHRSLAVGSRGRWAPWPGAEAQGRSFWILDDVTALRQAKPELATAPAHLFAPSPAYRFGGPEGRGATGKNPPYGARLSTC